MADANRPRDAREVLLDALLEKVADEQFPSATMLNQIEELLEPDEVQIYARVLVKKIREDTFPSIPMIRRVAALVQ
ncbi:hypothetical protein [Kribbella sp. NPDC023855]|uniref:hypothetical protein n=1 Tax=Kribbella sp. NPDC023855 TaxID=3154698 RepID=UPI0033E51EAF